MTRQTEPSHPEKEAPSAPGWKETFLRAALFSLASNMAVLFVLKFGVFLWPERLPANSQNLFWLASGVNVSGLLILGFRFWPVLLLNAFPAWLLAGEQLDLVLLGSFTNALEALLAAWAMRRFGAFDGRIDRVRTAGALVAASLIAPLTNTLVIPAWFCARGMLAWADYPHALANWNLSNGAAMLILVSLVFAIRRGEWSCRRRPGEALLFGTVAVVVSSLAFASLFSGAGLNFAFVVFPLVLFAAVRFGAAEMSAVLGLVLVSIYGSLALYAHAVSGNQMAAAIWFVQAFCWVLAATGLIIAALVRARRSAEIATLAERERSLEISLSGERARLAALRYQLNPHFLFNSLNSIYSTLPATGAEVPRKMLTQLSGYLRSTLAIHEHDLVPLRDELRSMEQYLAIERTRFGDDLQVEIAAEESALCRMVPAFLLQPLVENAVVHGFSRQTGEFRLALRAEVRDGVLEIGIANSGPWQPGTDIVERLGAGPGLGLANTRRRIELLYGDKASLQVEQTEGWVRVKLAFPADSEGSWQTSIGEPPCAA